MSNAGFQADDLIRHAADLMENGTREDIGLLLAALVGAAVIISKSHGHPRYKLKSAIDKAWRDIK